ncbi:MAG: hypothetical protein EXQ98_00060 [Alphaproteobacteria bacterium]|nr:hypothetical protein [Alphaproteobacteria bacterium]
MDELSRALRQELERRDETILALEMLVVDQASRLLALEALVLETMADGAADLPAIKRRIGVTAERFRDRFEAIEGFAERAQRIAGEMLKTTAMQRPARAAKKAAPSKTKAKTKKKPTRR